MDSPEQARPPRALVVDDEANARLLAQACLEQIGVDVTCVGDGIAALEAAESMLPDLILLDVVMPELDGFTVCERLRAARATEQTPILLMTALDDLDAVERAYRVGATDFVTKPVNWLLLQHRARFILRASQAFEDLADSSRSLEHAQQLAHLGSWAWSEKEDRFSGSLELWRILGCDPGALVSSADYLAGVHPGDRAQLLAVRRAAIQERTPYEIDYRYLRPGNELRHLHERGEPADDRRGRQMGLTGTLHDETERRSYHQQIDYMSRFDPGTGLPNRVTLLEEFRAVVSSVKPGREGGAIYQLKLGGLGRAAGVLGHDAVDEIVQRASGRLQRLLQTRGLSDATSARIDHHRLAVLLPRLSQAQDVRELGGEIGDVVGGRYDFAGEELTVDTHIGVARFPENGADENRLLSHALAAARTAAAGEVVVFEPALEQQDRGRLMLETELTHAIERGELVMHYQPIVRTDDGSIHSFEALVRWNCAALGPISPARFIPVAEELGIIDEITSWTLEQACRDAAAWSREAPTPPVVAVNLSATQLRARGALIDSVRAVLERTGLPAERLELELTETVLVKGLGDAVPVLRGLRALGVGLALDDFGTGFSSLSYLARFPMTMLKVDQAFLADIPGSAHTENIVQAMVAMSHKLGLAVVCEGIETDEQLEFIRAAGADYGQGYLLARPMPAVAAAELLRSGRPLIEAARRRAG